MKFGLNLLSRTGSERTVSMRQEEVNQIINDIVFVISTKEANTGLTPKYISVSQVGYEALMLMYGTGNYGYPDKFVGMIVLYNPKQEEIAISLLDAKQEYERSW